MKTKITGERVLFCIALLLVAVTHLVLLDRLPRGLNVDEAGCAYDAYTLGHFGVDRWMKSWPLYLKNYGDGANILYTYLLVPVFLVAGTSVYAVRSVIAASAILMGIAGAASARILFGKERDRIAFLFLYAVLPVFVLTQRFGLESHLFMGMEALCLYLILRAVSSDKTSDYLLFGIFQGLTLYTYAISYMVVPVFLLFSLSYLILKKKAKFWKLIAAAVPIALLAAPLAVVQIINLFDLPELKLGVFTFTKLHEYRESELMVRGYLKTIWEGLRSTFLFDDLRYNSSPLFGNFYYISVPFLLIGLVHSFYCLIRSLRKTEKISLLSFPLFFWIAYTLVSGLMSTEPEYVNLTRMNGVLAALVVILYDGIRFVLGLIRQEKWKKAAAGFLAIAYGCFFLWFSVYYVSRYDEWAYPYKWLFYEPYDPQIMDYLDDPENGYADRTVHLPWNYMYYLWEAKPDPRELNLVQAEEGDRDIKQIGRYTMEGGVNLNEEYVIYKYGYTAENHALYRRLCFTPFETEHFVLYLDPLRRYSFFGKNAALESLRGGPVTVRESYISYTDDRAVFYGWVILPEDFGSEIRVTLTSDAGEKDLPIVSDVYDGGRVICFMQEIDPDDFFGSTEKSFAVYGYDAGVPVGEAVRAIEADL
ncbi:MAG: glycosyltransferase family 39 protein [Lachnospiraceae bacterium]|nr:glycosyltransferase family 39 protein [Lachnospiraceae bacterium]